MMRAAFPAVCFCRCEAQIRCDARLAMAEKLADLDEVHTLGNRQARGGMSHVVEPYVRRLSCGQETRKRPSTSAGPGPRLLPTHGARRT